MQYDAELFFEAPTKLGMMIDDTLRLVCVYMLLFRENFSVNKFGNVQGPTFGLVKVQLARLYLRTLYVILPIHLNFPIRSSCVLKTVIEQTQCFVSRLLEKVFFFPKKIFILYMHLIFDYFFHFITVSIFHVSLSITYLLFSPYHVL